MTDKRIARDGETVAAEIAIADQTGGVAFVDTSPLTGVKRHKDGYIGARVLAARTGVQVYLGSEVGFPDRETVAVYRPEDEVMRIDALASYKGKPVTDGHPTERVTADNWRTYARGTVMGVAREGDAVALDIAISDAGLVDTLEKGEARQLSAGYTATLDRTPGIAPDGTPYDAVQRNIYIDHLAVVTAGRAGSKFRVGDGADEWGAAPLNTQSRTKGDNMSDNLRTVTLDGLSVKTTDEGAAAITKLQDALAAETTKVADQAKTIEAKDGEIAALKQSLADATDPKVISDMAKKRAKTMDMGKKYGMCEDEMDKMDDAAIARAIVTKRLGDAAKDLSDEGVNGALAALEAQPQKQNDNALKHGLRTADADPWGFVGKEA